MENNASRDKSSDTSRCRAQSNQPGSMKKVDIIDTVGRSFMQGLSEEQDKLVSQFLEELKTRRLLSEIQKMQFDRAHMARFLYSN